MILRSVRNLSVLQAFLCVTAIGVALALEVFLKLEPCPLCILQRLIIVAILFISVLMVFFHKSSKTGIFLNIFVFVLIVLGGGVAARHIWLQSLPPEQVPSCGPGFEYLLKTFPPYDILRLILKGSGECAKVGFRFLTLSLPQWTMLFYGMLLFINQWGFVLSMLKLREKQLLK